MSNTHENCSCRNKGSNSKVLGKVDQSAKSKPFVLGYTYGSKSEIMLSFIVVNL